MFTIQEIDIRIEALKQQITTITVQANDAVGNCNGQITVLTELRTMATKGGNGAEALPGEVTGPRGKRSYVRKAQKATPEAKEEATS